MLALFTRLYNLARSTKYKNPRIGFVYLDGYVRELVIDNARNEPYNKVRVFRSELLDRHILSRPPNQEAVPTVSSLSA
jgi:hypothetical protein